jgi:hypothetical protein
MEAVEVVRIVRRGALYLAESLSDYWPPSGENDLPERNISLHMAQAFAEQGFRCYGEVNPCDRTDERLDLLAFQPAGKTVVVIECKKLHQPERLEDMLRDAERILAFRPQDRYSPELTSASRFGVLAASTWNDKAAAWWAATDGIWDAGEARWGAYLKNRPGLSTMMNDKALFGSVIVQGFDGQKHTDPFHYILYCVFPVQPA